MTEPARVGDIVTIDDVLNVDRSCSVTDFNVFVLLLILLVVLSLMHRPRVDPRNLLRLKMVCCSSDEVAARWVRA